MKQIQLLLCGLFFFHTLLAQDAYHSNLAASLSSEYGLPSGEWLIADNEAAIYSSVVNWGNNESVINVSDQDFASASQIVVNQTGNNPWDSGWKIGNVGSVQDEDKVLLVLWLRSQGGPGKVNVFVERGTTFEKQIYITVNLTEEWTQFLLPFEADGSYGPNQLDLGLHLAFQPQTVQLGGLTAINYGNAVNLSDLPAEFHNDKYGGYEEDAPWRAEAATRIENLRKANLVIKAEQPNGGAPIASAIFDVKMISHEFAFGSAITAARIAGNNNQNAFYENKIINLDG
ncbi:MAG: hypothetical protein AAF985_07160, partial [Bacteroidota bacterium]